jgi:hypothetical protein
MHLLRWFAMPFVRLATRATVAPRIAPVLDEKAARAFAAAQILRRSVRAPLARRDRTSRSSPGRPPPARGITVATL